MNLYALLSLFASETSILLGLSVYLLNRKSSVNRLFMLTMFANAYWAFCTFMKTIATSIDSAYFWSKALSFWPLLVALMLHFSLAFTENDLLKKKVTYALVYLPPLIFSIIDLTTNWITGTLVQMPWGYITVLNTDSVLATLGGIWSVVLGLLAIFFYVNYYREIVDRTRKQQTKFVAIGLSVPIVMSVISDSVFPAMNVNFPGLGSISGSITSVIVLYGMLKYGLFSFRLEIAAENIISTMPDSVILVNSKGVIVKVNKSLIELTGYSDAELVGQPVFQMLQRASVVNGEGAVPTIFGQLQKVREVHNYEIIFETRSGERKTGMLSCSVVTDNNCHDIGYAFILHDITGRKLMEQKLLRAERLASIGELSGLIGHDLRNPLSGIRGAAFYLKRKHKDHLDTEDIMMFDSIDKSINYSNKIINDLLEYSSEVCLDRVTVEPKALVQASLNMVDPPDNIVVIDETSEVPVLFVDADKLQRGFAGIVKNAFDAMPEGGELRINSMVEGRFVVFTFNDTGSGMTEETLSKLWSPLFTTKAKGMGFGLAICRRIVEAHEGRISAVSDVGQGTTVRVEFPLESNVK